ncbi:MAG: PrsW family intramembrane metalloprotease [Spirochaetaceae bacterium]|nr:PrsW family intramembrane metalloprotease [Spirochaetaceae bacterium]
MRSSLLLILVPALLPVILILRYIYRLDKNEREPLSLVVIVAILGAIFALPCSFVESFLLEILAAAYSPESVKYALIENTICVALVEELFKWLVIMIFVWKDRNFDYRYDGIVYAVAASLGFAALENVLYISRFGIEVALGRAIFAIPGHTTFAVFMGFNLSRAKASLLACDPRGLRRYKLLALVIPMLIHGLYDFLLSDQADAAGYGSWFFVFVILLDIIAWIVIKHEFRTDQKLDKADNSPVPPGV